MSKTEMSAQHTPGPSSSSHAICECCYVVHGWIRSCNCKGGPTRTDSTNPFGLVEPWIDKSMGRNERPDIVKATGSA